jgi:hypothetical protein
MDGAKRPARALWEAARSVMSFIAELNYCQRRVTTLWLAPDRYVPHPDQAPDSYQEFVARTSGPLMREPSSRARLAGRRVG